MKMPFMTFRSFDPAGQSNPNSESERLSLVPHIGFLYARQAERSHPEADDVVNPATHPTEPHSAGSLQRG